MEGQGANQATIEIDEFKGLLWSARCSRGRTKPDGLVIVARKGPFGRRSANMRPIDRSGGMLLWRRTLGSWLWGSAGSGDISGKCIG